jgi:DNA-binding NarL/FixJ family response regulator
MKASINGVLFEGSATEIIELLRVIEDTKKTTSRTVSIGSQRQQKKRKYKKSSPSERKEAKELFREGLSIYAISKRLNRNHNTIKYFLKRNKKA